MANDFRSARFWAREMMEAALFPGARVIDATMGNGHDTLWLSELVGDEGKVYAFDIQQEAVDRTQVRLENAGLSHRAVLYCESHANLNKVVTEPVDAIMFNLGWLPGAEHGVTTMTESTLQAVNAACRCLKEDAILLICIYPGHEEGTKELHALLEWGRALDPLLYDVMYRTYLNQPNDPPRLLAVRKLKRRKNK